MSVMVKPKYPNWKIKGSPTPNDKLVICDQCGLAQWGFHAVGLFSYCTNEHGRMREATPEEYDEGKAAIEKVI